MKMGSAKLCDLLAASFLFLTLWIDPTEACTCMPRTTLQAYCSAEIVLKAQVLGAIDNTQKFERRYEIKVTKVLKGPKSLTGLHSLYTRSQPSLCGYELPTPFNQDEYVLTVKQYDNSLFTTLCDFNERLDRLSYEDKKGIEGGFEEACN